MKSIQSLCLYLIMGLITLQLTSCGSGDDTAGIDASGSPVASQGTIDGFGSVIVNGIRFDSSKALILVNGQAATEDDLRTGYQVTVTGTLDENGSGVAEKIEFYPELIGEITQIDEEKNQLLVSGRLVQINFRTLFGNSIESNNIDGLTIGDRVQISGHQNTEQLLTATRIDIDTGLTTNLIQLSGEISNLNESMNQFIFADTVINYAGSSLINIYGNRLINRMRVTVKGTKGTMGEIQAQQIYDLNYDVDSDIQYLKIEGRITRFTSTTDFEVNGIRCTANSQTQYEFAPAINLQEDASVEISGSKNSSGILVANRIQFDLEDENHVEGQVVSISINSGYIVTGSLQIGDVTVKTTSSTRYEDRSDSYNRRFNLSSIQVGDYLFVTMCNQNGELVASKIERKSPGFTTPDLFPDRKK
jgi:Domain of unknown function (DUF5666)